MVMSEFESSKLRKSSFCACAIQIWPETVQNDWRYVGRPSSCNAFVIATFSNYSVCTDVKAVHKLWYFRPIKYRFVHNTDRMTLWQLSMTINSHAWKHVIPTPSCVVSFPILTIGVIFIPYPLNRNFSWTSFLATVAPGDKLFNLTGLAYGRGIYDSSVCPSLRLSVTDSCVYMYEVSSNFSSAASQIIPLLFIFSQQNTVAQFTRSVA